MRVLMFGWEFPPYLSGGLGTACYGMTQALIRSGTKIVFVLPRSEDNSCYVEKNNYQYFPKIRSAADVCNIQYKQLDHLTQQFQEIWEKNFSVHPVKVTLHPYISFNQTLLSQHATKDHLTEHNTFSSISSACSLPPCCGGYGPRLMEEVFRYSQAAAQIAIEEVYDVIHVHDWMTFPAGIIAKKISKKPLITHVHATEFDRCGDSPNQDILNIEKTGLEHADHIVAVSHYTRNIIMKKYHIPEEKISVVHNAVLPASINHSWQRKKGTNKKYVLFLGRVTHQKAPEHFINAAYIVSKKLPNVNFIMAGSGDMLPSMINKVASLRLGNRFHFTGFLHNQQVEHIYSLSNIYVMPSISEPFGITPLEAIRHGIPVIISKQSGVSEVLKSALQVDFWDIERLAHLICSLLIYPRLKKSMMGMACNELQSIRWENAAQQLCHIYSKLNQNG